MTGLLDRAAVVRLLEELGRRLHVRGVMAEIYVVGGSAIILAYDRERLTRDIDAIWDESWVLAEVVSEIAEEHGLPRDWLNDRVRPGMPATSTTSSSCAERLESDRSVQSWPSLTTSGARACCATR